MSRLIPFSRPEAGAVRCQHLIAQDDIAVFIQTELEFGVCDDDPLCQSVISALFVEGNSVVAKAGCILLAFSREIFLQMSDALLVGDVFIVSPISAFVDGV